MKTSFPIAALALSSLLATSAATAQTAASLPVVKTTSFRADTVSIVKHGAVADGLTLNTQAIQKAIDACSQQGGGVVLVPRGHWRTAGIEMRSNVNLHLAQGALVQFTDDHNAYHLIKTNWEGVDAVRNQALIYGDNLENVAITGKGIFDGAGNTWRPVKKNKLTETQWKRQQESGVLNEKKDTWYPSASALKGTTIPEAFYLKPGKEVKDYEDIKDFLRPDMLVLARSKRILLEGVTFQNSPAWTIHPLMSEDIIVRNVKALNPEYGQNTDALDLESCRNGIVEGCTFDVGDDAICIKSGRDEQGRKRGLPTENFIIRNTTVYHAHGGFVIGSEMSGGARNIYVSNVNFIGTDVGLRFKTTRGRGGVVENIFIENVDMKDIPGQAIIFDMYYMAKDPVPLAGESTAPPVIEAKPLDEGTPQFRKIQIRNVTCNGAETAIMVRGLPEMPIKDISIENAVLQSKKGLVCIEASGIKLKNVTLLSTQTLPVMEVQNSQNITLDGIRYTPGAELLMRVTGDRSKDVKLANTDTKQAKKSIEFGDKVSKKTVTVSQR
ncbi:glycoside hydrolase family 28 protein [Hymenobacter busanensis]|uniref:Glycoside hydrolase family 28 protein n=1 Tax=Hymenobacter busanensis TaxID=2607656 RepID=A0A7L4ZUG2_9BACT|nr:glycoside hydrolase family 28 protein [Hymenobacter busanensis]KAA9339174.1 glycoside hydrolase family 28 protein [Hymenobacter busanensis]QHJ07064.1 glycoside hydrolase family 28 protein [Hymenobacter busanensis]